MEKTSQKKTPKISLIGAGNIGGTCAHLIAMRNLADVVLFDVVEGLPQGKALDLATCSPMEGWDVSIMGTNDYSDISDSDAIVVTAGITRPPAGTASLLNREALLSHNAKVIREVAENIKKYSPNAFVIVVTNPLDAMTWLLREVSGLHRQMVVGMAGGLDSSRFNYFLGKELGIPSKQIQSTIIGAHGDTMVILPRFSYVNGISLDKFLDNRSDREEIINRVTKRTKGAGGEVVTLLKTSAYRAPATAVLQLLLSYLNNTKTSILCSALLDGEYGVHDLCVGVPALIGSKGVEQIKQLDLQDKEKEDFQNSASYIQKLVDTLKV